MVRAFRVPSLRGADLIIVPLSGADLRGANLSGAEGLTQGQLDDACGDEKTKLDPPEDRALPSRLGHRPRWTLSRRR